MTKTKKKNNKRGGLFSPGPSGPRRSIHSSDIMDFGSTLLKRLSKNNPNKLSINSNTQKSFSPYSSVQRTGQSSSTSSTSNSQQSPFIKPIQITSFEDDIKKLTGDIIIRPELMTNPEALINYLNNNDTLRYNDSILNYLYKLIPQINDASVLSYDDTVADNIFEQEMIKLATAISKDSTIGKDPSKFLDWLQHNSKLLSILKKHLKKVVGGTVAVEDKPVSAAPVAAEVAAPVADKDVEPDDSIPKFENKEELKSWLKGHPCLIKELGMSCMPSMGTKQMIDMLFNNCAVTSILKLILSPATFEKYKEFGDRLKTDSDKLNLDDLNIGGELFTIVSRMLLGAIPIVGTASAEGMTNVDSSINKISDKGLKLLDKAEQKIGIGGSKNKKNKHHKHNSVKEFHKTNHKTIKHIKTILHGGPY
jgi:hypothetical protein